MNLYKKGLSIVLVFTFIINLNVFTKIESVEGAVVGENSTISTTGFHSAVIKEDGSLWVWGENGLGQIGDGTTTNRTMPVKVMNNVTSVYTSYYNTFAIKEDGSLWVWGENSSGQIGDGTTTNRTTPVKVLNNVTSVYTSYYNTFAIKEDGSLWAWGKNSSGQIGDGTTTNRTTPVKVLNNVTSVYTSYNNTFAIKEDGSLWGWGENSLGQIGDGTTTNRTMPVKVLDKVVDVNIDSDSALAIKEDGSLWGWGSNYGGQLGDVTITNSVIPVKIMDNVLKVYSDTMHVQGAGILPELWAIKNDQSLWGWGTLRNIDDHKPIIPEKEGENVNELSFGAYVFDLKENGSLYLLADNTFDLKNNLFGNNKKVMDDVIQIIGKDAFSIALKKDGTLWMWESKKEYYGSGQFSFYIVKTDLNLPVKIMDNVKLPSTVNTDVNTYTRKNSKENIDSSKEVYYFDDLNIGDKFGNGVVREKSQDFNNYKLKVNEKDVFKGKIALKCFYSEMSGIYEYIINFDYDLPNTPTLIINDHYRDNEFNLANYWIYLTQEQIEQINNLFTEEEANKVKNSEPISLDLYIEASDYSMYITPNSDGLFYFFDKIEKAMRYEEYEVQISNSDNLILEKEEKAPIDFKSIINVTDEESAKSSIFDIIASLTENEKQLSYNIDNIELAVEGAISNSAKIGNGKRVIKYNDLIDKINEAKNTKISLEEIMLDNGISQNRDIRTSVSLASSKSDIKIQFDNSIENLEIDQILVSTNEATLKLPANIFDGQLFNVKINKITDLDRFLLEKEARIKEKEKYSNMSFWQKILEFFKSLFSKFTTVNNSDSDIIEDIVEDEENINVDLDKDDIWYNFEINKDLNEVITISLPILEGETENQTIIRADGTNVAGKYNVATNTIDARVNEAGIYAVKEIEADFSDIVEKDIEMQKAIKYISSKGIVTENYFDEFKPDEEISRAEIITLLIKALGKYDINADGGFDDVKKQDWYFAAAGSAKNRNIIYGYEDNTFRGMNNILKNEFTVLSSNTLMEEMGYYGAKDIDEYLKYDDFEDIAEWAKDSVALATRETLIIQNVDNTFNGSEAMTRGEAAVVIYRLFNKLW